MTLRISFVAAALLTLATSASAVTRTVCTSGCDFSSPQGAFNAAVAGDTIIIQAGQTFTGSITIPTTQHASVVTVKSSTACPSRRMTSSDSTLMPTITVSASEQALVG